MPPSPSSGPLAPGVPQVFFESIGSGIAASDMPLPHKVSRLFDRAGMDGVIAPGDLVAIKVHFGEPGNTTFLSPLLVRPVVDKVKEAGGRPFLTDVNTIYMGKRANSVDHIEAALGNGWEYSVVDAPIIIADGIRGHDYVKVPVGGKHFEEVKIASAVVHADALIVLSHFKGHMLAGFGGAIKNIGMGLGSRAGKREMHSDGFPVIRYAKCIACGVCAPFCPVEAMNVESGEVVAARIGAAEPPATGSDDGNAIDIDYSTCISCGECATACPYGAIGFDWKTDHRTFQEKMVEYTKGVLSGKMAGKIGYMNFLMNMTPDCDCLSWSDPVLLPDIGIVASIDLVATEQASLDLVAKAWSEQGGSGEDPFIDHHSIDGRYVTEYAEALGLGSREYRLR